MQAIICFCNPMLLTNVNIKYESDEGTAGGYRLHKQGEQCWIGSQAQHRKKWHAAHMRAPYFQLMSYIWGAKMPKSRGKQHERRHCNTPLYAPPSASKNFCPCMVEPGYLELISRSSKFSSQEYLKSFRRTNRPLRITGVPPLLMQSKASPGEVEAHHHPESRKEVSSQSGKETPESPSLGLYQEEINPGPTTPRRASNKASRRGRHLPVLSFSLTKKTKNQGKEGQGWQFRSAEVPP